MGKGQGILTLILHFSWDYLNNPQAFTYTINLVEQEWITENGVAKTQRNYTEINYEK